MSWQELILDISDVDSENFSEALLDAGALSVTIEDAHRETPEEKPIFGEPGLSCAKNWAVNRLSVLLNQEEDTQTITDMLYQAAQHCNIALPAFTLRSVAEKDWVSHTQKLWEPQYIGKNICILPSWYEKNASLCASEKICLHIDPGLAFGTGSHPTTSLCLSWLETHFSKTPVNTVLDYGCGSGVLSILAALLGAKKVVAVDIDPQALTVTQENSTKNLGENGKNIITSYLPETFSALQNTCHRFDIVIANILEQALINIAGILCDNLRIGASLVLSGILISQEKTVINAYASRIKLERWQQIGDWVLLNGIYTGQSEEAIHQPG